MRGFWDDLRFAARRLTQQKAFAFVAILALSLGLGANTAVFTLIHAVMFRTLPVTRPSELVRLGGGNDCCVNNGLARNTSLFSYLGYEQLRDQLTDFESITAFQANVTPTGIRQASGGAAQSLRAAYVSGSYFKTLGVSPAAGRLLEPSDDEPSAAPAAVISYQAWRDQYAGDPSVVGQTFYVNGTAMTLAGVAPPEFFGETVRPDPVAMWLPLGKEPLIRGVGSLNSRPDQNWLYIVGRQKNANLAALSAKATRALQNFLGAQTFLTDRQRSQIGDQTITAVSAASGVQLMRGNFGQSLTLLFAMSGLVLLIASANLANLLLARADRGQTAIRAALGATSPRLVRQAFAEGLVLAIAGAAGSLLVATFATRAILTLAFATPGSVPIDAAPSAPVLAFSAALTLITAVIFSAAPAWAMAKTNPIDALRGLGKSGGDVAFMPRRSLVIVQVTLSLILLAGAGVLTKSLSRLENQSLGFNPNQRLIVRIDPPQIASERERLANMYIAMRDKLKQIPGVVNASYALYSPMEGNNWSSGITIAGRPPSVNNPDSSSWNRVGPGFFETMGTRLLRGRVIQESDTPTSQRIAVVNNAFVQQFLKDRDPIGATFSIGETRGTDFEIVGVVEDVKYTNANLPARAMAFLPTMQNAPYESPQMKQVEGRSMLARTVELQVAPGTGNIEPQIRRALSEVHPDLTVTRVLPITEQISGNFRNNRLLASLTTAYGALALALASLGLYGVTSYGVSRRLQEIGIRMALGADRSNIVWTIVRGALMQTAFGVAVGIPLALFGAKTLTSQLFDVNARDPIVIALAAAALLITSAAAALLPARRAASVSPTSALRSN